MPVLLWNASALCKRYTVEAGSDVVDALFDLTAPLAMVGTLIGYAETFSILLRKRNRGAIAQATYLNARSLLRDEVVTGMRFRLLTVDDAAVLASIGLMERYNLNATDAAILSVFLEYVDAYPLPRAVVVTSDQRLAAACRSAGLEAVNPEATSLQDVASLVNTP